MNINSNVGNGKVEIFDSVFNLPATIEVNRSKKDLLVKLKTDTTDFDYIIKASKNSAFLFGNLIFSWGAPIGYLVDLTNQKRFYYGHTVFLNTSDTVRIIGSPIAKTFHDYFSRYYPKNKGEIYLQLSFPWVNSFNLKPEGEPVQVNTGFMGISLGLDYWYSKTRFFNLGFSQVADFFFPLPAPIEYGGEYNFMNSRYISFSSNYQMKRFTIGYGLVYAKNTWDHRYYNRFNPPPPVEVPVKKSHYSFGLIFPVYYQVASHFYLGLLYRPTFLRPGLTEKLKYEHLISLDFSWKIRLKK